jgi:site-specific DNA recombinase
MKTKAKIRCAVYTRKSTEEGLDKEFNSLDAQREAALAYIASQKHEGWTCVPQRYDDGGFTGGNMERPALQRLLNDIAAGRIDCVTVYKVDRLSRSLLDFARMMEVFQQHNVAFVSVTQHFNTATSMGRLVLNVLLSFAQFEREIISERTRDKIAAARRKGKWSGGHPILGYDIDPRTFKLVVNEQEAERVRAIFALYLRHGTLAETLAHVHALGWTHKRWLTRKGHERGGSPFTKGSLHRFLCNVAYAGKVRYKNEVHQGEQPAIVDENLWQQVQEALRANRQAAVVPKRGQSGATLKGLLHCAACGSRMIHTHAVKNGSRYRYYRCGGGNGHADQRRYVAALALERHVFEQIRAVATQHADANPTACEEDKDLAREDRAGDQAAVARLFDPAWEAVAAQERSCVLHRLVERIDYHATTGDVAIRLRADAASILSLALIRGEDS